MLLIRISTREWKKYTPRIRNTTVNLAKILIVLMTTGDEHTSFENYLVINMRIGNKVLFTSLKESQSLFFACFNILLFEFKIILVMIAIGLLDNTFSKLEVLEFHS